MKYDWIMELFQSIDRKNIDEFVSFIANDGSFTFGNNSTVTGKANIYEAVGGFFDSIKSLKHKDIEIFESGNAIFTTGNVTYTRHDDTQLSVDFCNRFDMNSSKIKSYKIYVDTSELYK